MPAARHEPVFGHGPHGPHEPPAPHALGHAGVHVAPRPTGFARFIAGVQILGTVLGIPLGLASGYSIYHANFSPEAKCGALRGNIISMLDKNADATTLRLLVRRDVATFEQSCGAVDPDAVAAFKTLLARPTAVATAPKRVETVETVKAVRPVKVENKVAHAAEPAAHTRAEAARHETAPAAHADARAVHAKADADWLAAVRRALVEHGPVTRAQAAEAPVPPAPRASFLVPSMPAPLPASTQAAPVLPPAAAVADAPAAKSGESHPVPPALIPDAGPPPAR